MEPLRKSQRISSSNLKQDNLVEKKANNKTYVLNVTKAISKKLSNCDAPHITTEMKQKNNLRIDLSTAAYELMKTRLHPILNNYIASEGYVIAVEMETTKIT